VLAALRELLGGSAAGARVLLLGAGGAARAALYALWLEGAGRVEIANRTPARSDALVALPHGWARIPGGPHPEVRSAAEAHRLTGERFDLVINATSLGMHTADPLPLPPEGGPGIGAALDLVYSPDSTRWVRELRTRGIPAHDGTTMLLHQGAAAFERWFGREAPMAVMREALASPGRA
jgi:shikimate dehydrogenase